MLSWETWPAWIYRSDSNQFLRFSPSPAPVSCQSLRITLYSYTVSMQLRTKRYNTLSCNTMQYHTIQDNTMTIWRSGAIFFFRTVKTQNKWKYPRFDHHCCQRRLNDAWRAVVVGANYSFALQSNVIVIVISSLSFFEYMYIYQVTHSTSGSFGMNFLIEWATESG